MRYIIFPLTMIAIFHCLNRTWISLQVQVLAIIPPFFSSPLFVLGCWSSMGSGVHVPCLAIVFLMLLAGAVGPHRTAALFLSRCDSFSAGPLVLARSLGAEWVFWTFAQPGSLFSPLFEGFCDLQDTFACTSCNICDFTSGGVAGLIRDLKFCSIDGMKTHSHGRSIPS